MANYKVEINKITSGSDAQMMGETTLSYTDGVSDFARNICNSFSDSKGELNPKHSTFMMLYDTISDRYVFTHIQAQEWIFEGGARKYPFRGAYEISREDYLKLSVSSIVDALPRIDPQSGKQGKVPAMDEILNHAPIVSNEVEVRCLSSNIQQALSRGKYLFVKLDGDGGDLRENSIFESHYFRILLQAIDNLPIDFKKYATFSFLSDNNYEYYLRGCEVNLYLADSDIQIPESSIIMDWNEVIRFSTGNTMPSLPPISDGILPLPEALKMFQHLPEIEEIVNQGEYDKLSLEDWKLWLESGHKVSTLFVKDQATYKSLLSVFAETGKPGLENEFAQTVLNKGFLLGLKGYNENGIKYWESELSKHHLWTKELVATVWSMWGTMQKDTISSLIDFVERNNMSGDDVSNCDCSNGLGKLPSTADEWALRRIYRYIKEKYDFSDAEKYPSICRSFLNDKVLESYVLDFKHYIRVKDILSYVEKCGLYINHLKGAEKVTYVKESKPLIWALCKYLQENSNEVEGGKLMKRCKAILHPNRKHHIHLAVACLAGALLGFFVPKLMGGGGEKEEPRRSYEEVPPIHQSFLYIEITDIPQLAQLYFSKHHDIIKCGNDTMCIDSIADVEKMYAKLRNTTDTFEPIQLLFKERMEDGEYHSMIRTIGKDSTLFMVLKDLPQGSRLDHIKHPSDDTKLLDITNSKGFIYDKLRNGDCPLTYYFWLIKYLEDKKDKLNGIKIAY